MKLFSLILLPLIFISIFTVLGINYYSLTTSILFTVYMLILLLLSSRGLNFKAFMFIGFIVTVLIVQRYSIVLTNKSITMMNDNPGYYEYGSDFLVIISWFSLLISIVWLNIRAFKKLNGVF